jgi:hypothetical protein
LYYMPEQEGGDLFRSPGISTLRHALPMSVMYLMVGFWFWN